MYIHCMSRKRPANRDLPAGVSAFNSLLVQDGRVFKAGNSLAIRIPSAIAKHCDLDDGTSVQMAAEQGMIYVRKAASRDLTALLERITPENIHSENFDKPAGGERW